MLRAAILYLEGGLYLDMDTVTTSSLLPLLNTRQFVGCEFIIWPHFARTSRSPVMWARSLTLDLTRKLMRRMPRGWKMFRLIEKFCYRGINNAVMGAEADSPLFEDYLRAMLTVPPERQGLPYALGPDLLQDVVGRYARDDLTIQEPHVFYPLPPEISEHWFRIGRSVRLDAVLTAETRVVHWYASVGTKSRVALINPNYVRTHRETSVVQRARLVVHSQLRARQVHRSVEMRDCPPACSLATTPGRAFTMKAPRRAAASSGASS